MSTQTDSVRVEIPAKAPGPTCRSTGAHGQGELRDRIVSSAGPFSRSSCS